MPGAAEKGLADFATTGPPQFSVHDPAVAGEKPILLFLPGIESVSCRVGGGGVLRAAACILSATKGRGDPACSSGAFEIPTAAADSSIAVAIYWNRGANVSSATTCRCQDTSSLQSILWGPKFIRLIADAFSAGRWVDYGHAVRVLLYQRISQRLSSCGTSQICLTRFYNTLDGRATPPIARSPLY